MSSDPNICPHCQKKLANKYNLLNHIKTFHENGLGVDSEPPKCQSERCLFTARYRCELDRHQQKCLYFLVDRETEKLRSSFREEISKIKSEYESKMQQMKAEYESRMLEMPIDYKLKIAVLQKEQEMLKVALDARLAMDRSA